MCVNVCVCVFILFYFILFMGSDCPRFMCKLQVLYLYNMGRGEQGRCDFTWFLNFLIELKYTVLFQQYFV